ncbi:MAG: hypothetical protein D6744_07525, partial [Planctomycetota bacterium]
VREHAPNFVADTAQRRPARHRGCACFAPGTDPAVITKIENRLFGGPGEAFTASARWSVTASGVTGASGDPVTLTYSFVPDGAISSGGGTIQNTLFASLDGQFGSTDAWKQRFRDAFDAWGQLTGVTFVEESNDDGADWPDSPGVLGVRGDIRIVGLSQDGVGGVLAYNYFPDLGDMAIDVAENWSAAANDYRFMRNILMHEIGHGMGLGHVYPTDSTKLMEPILSTSFDGPQDDDIRGGTYLYGDGFEKNGALTLAADLGSYTNGMPVDAAGLRDQSDEDWYFVAASPTDRIAVSATPLGGLYYVGPTDSSTSQIDTRAVNALVVEVYDESGGALIRRDAAPAGQPAQAAPFSIASGESGFLIRVLTESAQPDVQRYQLALVDSATPLRTIAVAVQTGSGDVSVSPPDVTGIASADMPVTLTYLEGESVTLTAPAGTPPILFDRWIIDGVLQPEGQQSVTVSVDANVSAVANYGELLYVVGEGARPIVAGESLTLTANASGGEPPYAYAWSPAQSLSSASGASVVASPVQTTTYTVTVTDSAGKQAVASMTVEIVDALAVDAGDDREVIAGSPANLHAAASGGVPPYSYQWSPGEFGVATDQANYAPALTESTDFVVTVSDSDGRTATDAVRITVIPQLTVSIGDEIWATPSELLTLSAAVAGGEPPYEFAWFHNGLLAQSGGDTLNVQTNSSTAYLVVVTDASGQEVSDSVHISVVQPLEASIGAASRELMAGEAMMLIGRGDGGAPPYRFQWSPESGLDAADAAIVTARPEVTTTYTLTVYDATDRSATAQITLNVFNVQGATAEGATDADASPPELAPMPVGLCGFGVSSAAFCTFLLMMPLRRRTRR